MNSARNFFRIIFFLFVAFSCQTSVRANDEWIQIRSKNFNLIGNADERDIRQAALKLEEFRAALSLLLPHYDFDSPIPTTVVVFKSLNDYKPFKPLKKNGETSEIVAGHFQAGKDVNYIALSTEGEPSRVFQIIFHEYTHFLIRSNLGESRIPPWFNEGIAAYYETFALDGEKKITLGKVPEKFLTLLRQNELIPFDRLFNVDNLSLHDESEEAVGLFYAQSWALMHFMIHGNNGVRKPQLDEFLNQVMIGKNPRTAFTEAFQTDYETIEKELKKYIENKIFQTASFELKDKLNFEVDEIKINALTEAEIEGYLGDLLFHSNRRAEAESRLRNALKLNPDLVMAQTDLGLIRLQERNYDEAEKYLENAVRSGSSNYLTHFFYAYALSRRGMSDFGFIISYHPVDADKMRKSLKKAIDLNPNYAESYDLYAFVNLVRNENLDEAVKYLNKALEIAPGNQWYLIHLAESYLGKMEFTKAREIAARVTATAGDSELKVYSQNALRRIISTEAAYADIEKNKNKPVNNPLDRELTDEELARLRARQIIESLNESLYKPKENEKRILGSLTEINCESKEIVYSVKFENKTLKLRSNSFDSVRFVAFTSEMSFSQIGCGAFQKQVLAVINYRPTANLKTSGEVVSIEFVPANFEFTN